jgi:putative Holliday junction resolvase
MSSANPATAVPQEFGAKWGGGPGTVLAFDFGTKRIGVATGELATRLAHPLTTIAAEGNAPRFSAIAALLAEWRPVALLVGLPRARDGSDHDMSLRCRRFANQLKGRFRLPVVLVDERLSSVEAAALLRDRQPSARTGRRTIDALAARIILQSYFDAGETLAHPA